MAMKTLILLLIFEMIMAPLFAKKTGNKESNDRMPAVAGSFYPAGKHELEAMLDGFFNDAETGPEKQPLALIVPHAGYVFSGEVAASAFEMLDRDSKFDRVFLIGSAHAAYFSEVAVYPSGNFITPLGKVPVDPLTARLADEFDFIRPNIQAHAKEHSLEVELPFLQYWLNKPFSIVPILIGANPGETSRNLASALKPYFNPKNLFVISTDFSHYPNYSDAREADRLTADAIVTNSPETFIEVKKRVEKKYRPSLVTACCGWASILSLLYITENNDDVSYQKMVYQNSGDSRYGDHDRVVGYQAIGVFQNGKATDEAEFSLSDDEKITLLKIARRTLNDYLKHGIIPAVEDEELTDNLLTEAGAFVTLKKKGALRGCIGNFKPDRPLYRMVQSMAVAAATNDHRFEPVTRYEIENLDIEISVLTPMRKIESVDEIEMGKHGIYIKKDYRAGTFLPQVATQTGWTKEEFLGHCARDKAHIGWDGWKDADVFIYEALVFGENEYPEIFR